MMPEVRAMTLARRALVAVAVLVLSTGAPAGRAWAGPPTDQLRAHIDQVLRVLEDPELRRDARTAERRAAIRKIAGEIFDFGETTRRSLGRHWQGRTPAERAEIVQLFTDLLERAYVGKIELYSGERIAYLGDRIEGDEATARTKLVTKQGAEVPVDYRMHRRGDRWLAYDVSIEGISLVGNYRTQFNKIIQTSSYEGLVARLRAKQDGPPGPAIKRTSQN
jgi:phospholipid transport system substrate-binding protein